MLKCTKCKIEKPKTLIFFPPHNKKKNGLDSWCRECRNFYRSEIRRGKYRDIISDELLIETQKEANGKCNICGKISKLSVDHDHKTNKFRGLLCDNCNLGLGHFKDDPLLLEFAIIYLGLSNGLISAQDYLKLHARAEVS